MSGFHYEQDQDGIVVVTMDMSGSVNAMNDEYHQYMESTLARLEAEHDIRGVVITSAKTVFFAGGDLTMLVQADRANVAEFRQGIESMKAGLRRLEKLPVPVVAAINGAALGGGYELCLVCNHRIAFNHASVKIGLPECSLGLFPGGGGVVRLTKKIGLEKALPLILEGARLTPEKAMSSGLIEQTVESLDDLLPAAKAWIQEHSNDADAGVQPWDKKGFKIPGGPINSPRNVQLAVMAPTMLNQKTRGLMPHMIAAMDVAFQSTMLDLDTALRIEGREFARIATNPVAKNMINAFFFQLNKVKGGASRPKEVAKHRTKKVGILGAGMMGQGIAYVSAMAGIEVILKDVSQAAAEKGKAYSNDLLQKRVKRKRIDQAEADAVLALIKPTANQADLSGCDLIIEAVFEDSGLKQKITAELEGHLHENGIWGSNTSTLPITQLAEASSKPENFIGVHFFSPVDKMPLVELICGEKTSDQTLAKAFDYTQQIRKTAIVVNDSLGFFTSRTFATYLDEAAHLLVEGVHPIRLEHLGKAIGMPVGPLQIQDETSLELSRKAQDTWAEMGVTDQWWDGTVIRRIIKDLLVDSGRGGRYHGGGYYEYHQDGSKTIWPGLIELYYNEGFVIDDQDIKDRLMFRQVIETLKCLESGVLRSVADGNIGSIFGIGAPAHTGGFIQFVNTYGLDDFMRRCEELSQQYGERFDCPNIVKQKALSGELFT